MTSIPSTGWEPSIAPYRQATQWRVIKQEYQACIAIYRIIRITEEQQRE